MTGYNGKRKSYKFRKSLESRKEEVCGIRMRYPTKIPVIVERYEKEVHLLPLDKTKFLAPEEITMSQFALIIRNRIHLNPTKAFYLIVNNRSIVSMSRTIGEVYREHRDEDGFLYITYTSQEVFGSPAKPDKVYI
ncbi:microtubule-associated proteins 1A/1B light chain 3C-like [Centruroides vittatus]|uniref:microtubule-associated proteins 1A/1B light chain 3C-like n=1 Tax=Centruroides vittatus TaxID=120091 RepID=UPI00350F3053